MGRFARDEWNLGIVSQSLEDIARRGIVEQVRWFEGNPWRIFADPCCLVHPDGSVTIVAEVLNHWTGKGQIQIATVGPGENPLRAVFRPFLKGPSHLSYPHLIMDQGVLYMTVESYEAGCLGLWRVEEQRKPVFVKTLLDRPAIDATIYHDGSLWWLFCTFFDDRPNTNLHLFYSPRLFGEWTPHPQNPIVESIRTARPAGSLFTVDGMLIRPSQDSSQTYGGQLTMQQVVSLTPDEYRETMHRVIVPPTSYYRDGIHTIVGAGEWTIIDGKRWQTGPLDIPCRISAKIYRSVRRLTARNLVPQGALEPVATSGFETSPARSLL